MSQTVRGVISRKKGEPVEVVDVVIPDPGPGEVVVDILACGVCHTDLTYREGGINDEFPFLLGHEAAGVVESVGEGVTGMKFREEDSMLSMSVIRRSAGALESAEVPEEDQLYVFTVTDGGFAKKTPVEQYRLQGRGGLGIKAMQITENRGELVGGLVLVDTDDVISVTAAGQVTRSLVSGVNPTGRGTMGVSFVKFKGDDRVVTIARNTELPQDEAQAEQTSTDEDQDQ